MNKVSVIVPIL
ncbi:Protein of unknown function [Bacillus cereus]|nr:Protein of unknown function [Bacillus cereus]